MVLLQILLIKESQDPSSKSFTLDSEDSVYWPWTTHSRSITLKFQLAWKTTDTHINNQTISEYAKLYKDNSMEYVEKLSGPIFPLPVDAPNSVCLGWLLYSTKHIHSEDYL